MLDAWCDRYAGPGGTTWPTTAFPAQLFPQKGVAWLRSARQAWDTYERVQAVDAATRVRLSGSGWVAPSWRNQTLTIWYVFQSVEERLQFRRGQQLHQQICPELNWNAQRNFGISEAPVTNVYPQPI